MTPPERVAVIGLGIMGGAFARHLQQAGYLLTGYDPDPLRCRELRESGGTVAEDCSSAARAAEVVFCSLPNDRALAATVASLTRLPPAERRSMIVVELSTLDPETKQRHMQYLAEHDITLLDCPVSGTGAQAAERDVIVYASGPDAAVKRVMPLLKTFSSGCFHLGAFGNGMRMKLIANLLVAVHNVATAEALALAQRAGIDGTTFCEVLGAGGAATSRILQLRAPLMAAGTYVPATMRLDLWQKDMSLIDAFARRMGVATPLFSATVPLYARAVETGLGAEDTAAIYKVLQGMDLPLCMDTAAAPVRDTEAGDREHGT
jgi:3-hydroxyisobutyrate dehydrogenase-like beta-hydroxyacid dehydrogenase